jgi:hypothetical protein
MQPLVNQICVVKTESRAPNEPLLNRSYGSAESRFFRRTRKDAQFKLGQRHGRILFVLLFASVLGNCVSSLEILDPIVLSKFSKSAGDILVKFLYCPQMYWTSCPTSVPSQTVFYTVQSATSVGVFSSCYSN